MITEAFDKQSEPVFGLRNIYGEPGDLADACIITFSKLIADRVLASGDCSIITQIGACNGCIPIYLLPNSKKRVAFYLSPIGSAVASTCLLDANWLTGAKQFVVFGSAGSLDGCATANRFVIPTYAYRDEGLSYHYAPPSDYLPIANCEAVRHIFDELRVPYTMGRTWTTDALYRETAAQTALRRGEGCLTVEMELAGLQAVCDFHKLNLFAFLETGDVLSENGYDISGLWNANHSADKFQLALKIAERV